VFSGLAALMISEIDDDDDGEVIVVRASTRGGAVECLSWGRSPDSCMPSASGRR
jgi:hypothetical protein